MCQMVSTMTVMSDVALKGNTKIFVHKCFLYNFVQKCFLFSGLSEKKVTGQDWKDDPILFYYCSNNPDFVGPNGKNKHSYNF